MKKFEEIVRSMSAKDIILAMVESLRDPCVILNMSTYGEVSLSNGKCYGCAATNTICRISGIKFTSENLESLNDRASAVNSDRKFLDNFESAIDDLRKGNIETYNDIADRIDIAKINDDGDISLPYIKTNFREDELDQYIKLANEQ
jgi:hypothetical protein